MKDPAFLFYDGDAARDVSHMNRLERGAYFDLIQAQRKFGGYTVEQARKILGKDFEDVWPALELILSKDDNEVFFIEWVMDSQLKRKEHAEKQRERIQNYWDKKKKEKDATEIPRNNQCNTEGYTKPIPLVNENEIENEIENIGKGGMGEKPKKIVKSKKIEFEFKLVFPFESPEFLKAWELWKQYKKEQHRFTYKSFISEQSALKDLGEMAEGNQELAISMINQSISKGWSGIFKIENYGKSTRAATKSPATSDEQLLANLAAGIRRGGGN